MVRFAVMADSRSSLSIPNTSAPVSDGPADWQAALADAVRDPAELCRLLRLDPSLAAAAAGAAEAFALLVPRPFVERITPGDPRDPLLLQVLPQAAELTPTPGFSADPLGEAAMADPLGRLSKYPGRSLIVATGRCGVHCRYCFRRHYPYGQNDAGPTRWDELVRAVSADRSLDEVILSGGDPLTLDDGRLAELAEQLAAIPHLRRLRVHSRMPVVIPQRVTQGLLKVLRGTRLTPIVVLQVNHPAEIDDAVAAATARLVDAGVPVLSQSVLLRGVNDSADVLAELCRRLIDLRVMPYYLHQLDRVAGAAAFEVPESTGAALIDQLRRRLPGYAVPRYVRETPKASCKRPLA